MRYGHIIASIVEILKTLILVIKYCFLSKRASLLRCLKSEIDYHSGQLTFIHLILAAVFRLNDVKCNIIVTRVIKSILIIFFSTLYFCANAYPDELKKPEALEWRSPIPRFQALGINPDYLYGLAKEKIALLVYPTKNIIIDNAGNKKTFINARLVSSITVIDAPVKEVKELIKDYASYSELMPRTENATIVQKSGKHSLVEYLLVFKMPVLAVKIKYIFQYTEENNGDISIRLHEGGGEEGASRWEFIPLSNGQTLLVFTTWNNLENSGYFFKTIVKAQPVLKTTIPEISAILAIDAIKKYFEKENRTAKITDEKKQFIPALKLQNKPFHMKLPQVPVFNIEEKSAIAMLSEFGVVLVLHPKKKFRKNSNEIIKLEYISLIKKDSTSVKVNQDSVLNFNNDTEFIPQLDQLHHKKTDTGFQTNWYLKYKFGFFTLPVNISLDYIWIEEDILYFFLAEGDIKDFYGVFNWSSMDKQNNDTFLQYTLAVNLGSKLPLGLKVLNKMPRQSLLSGLFLVTNFVESLNQRMEK